MKFFSNLFCSQLIRGPRSVKVRNNYTFNRVANGSSAPLSSCRAIETQLQIEISMDSQSAVAAAHKRIPTQLLDAWARIRTSQFWMVAIALFLRVGWIIVGHTYKFKSAEDNFGFGWEMGRIGAAIASGRGFSDAFGAPTGPTAWEPPLYPYLHERRIPVPLRRSISAA